MDIEAILALEPDLIVAIDSGIEAEEYSLLSRIAPTLARPAEYGNYGTPWDRSTRLIGRALGLEEKAESIISDLKNRIERIKKDNPAFVGASIAVAFSYDGNWNAYSSQDGHSHILTQLGFTIPKRIDELSGDSYYASFSGELIEMLDTDVLIWTAFGDKAETMKIKELPLRNTMRAYREGREMFVRFPEYRAFAYGTILSIPYALDAIVPGLIAAVDGDPATQVPENLR